jgi:hypothetical protein
MINDVDKKVRIILDSKLMSADTEFVSFHPMDNTASTAITKDGIQKLKEVSGRDDSNWEILDFATIAPEFSVPPYSNKK